MAFFYLPSRRQPFRPATLRAESRPKERTPYAAARRENWIIGAAYPLNAIIMVLSLLGTVGIGVPYWKERRQSSSEMYGLIEEWLGGTEDINASRGAPYVMVQSQRVFYKLYLATRKAFLFGSPTWGINRVFFGHIAMSASFEPISWSQWPGLMPIRVCRPSGHWVRRTYETTNTTVGRAASCARQQSRNLAYGRRHERL